MYRLIPTKKGREILRKLREHHKKLLKKSPGKKQVSLGKKDHPKLEKFLKKQFKKNMPKVMPKSFQHHLGAAMVIYDETAKEIFRCVGEIPKNRLKKIIQKHPNASVLIDLGSGIYKQIPIKSFKRLIKIQFIVFEREYEFFGIDGYEPESKSGDWFVPESQVDYIYSINQLLKLFIIEEAFDRANQLYVSARFYDLTGVEKTCKVLYKNGKVGKFKYKKFLEEYKLNLVMGIFEKKKNNKSEVK